MGADPRRGQVASPGRGEVQTLSARNGGGRVRGEVSVSPVPQAPARSPGPAPPRRAGALSAAEEAGRRFPSAPPLGSALGRPRAGGGGGGGGETPTTTTTTPGPAP